MRRLLLATLVLLLFAGIVHAENISVSFAPDSQVILLNETAGFQMLLSHDLKEKQSFEVFSSDVLWDVRLSEAPVVDVGEHKTVSLYLKPLYITPGVYGVPIYVRIPQKNIVARGVVFVDVRSTSASSGEYLPAIRGTASIKKELDPRETAKLALSLETQNKWQGNVTLKIRSKLFNKDLIVGLGGLENKTISVDFVLDPQTPPQQDTMSVTVLAVSSEGKAYPVALAPVEYSLMGYSDIAKQVVTAESFLKTVDSITLKNNGNAVGSSSYSEPSSFFASLFVSFDPAPEKAGGMLLWKNKLVPGSEFVITKTTSYRWIVVLLVLVILGIISYYIFRSPLSVKKIARVLATKEGGITELKVLVFVANRSSKSVNHVKVRDLVPRLALLEKEAEVGSPAPEKVLRNEAHGTLVKWEFNCLESGEERIIRYRIRSKLSIIDGLTLPPAVVTFETTTGRERKTASSSAEISLSSR